MKTLNRFFQIAIIAAAVNSSAHADNILSIRDTIRDPNLVYPESYEADVHKMLKNWYITNYVLLDKQADSTPDVYTTDEQYIERLKKMPTTIEMPFNEVVKQYIEMYTGRKRELVESMLGMSTYYMPIFEEALEKEGMPLELKYLPVVESALNPDAVSRAGATGLWQFMLATGRSMGLEINSLVDERRDPIKSSEAAAKFLKELYGIYGDWSLAIAAYNCGPGNVNKALRQAGSDKMDFWQIYPYLPKETKGYVPVFIAANYVMNYYDKHGISPALARRPILTDTVTVTDRVHFKQISEVLDIPVEALRILNPQYRQDVVPGNIRPYTLILPSHQALSFAVSCDSILARNRSLYTPRDVVEVNYGGKEGKKGKNSVAVQQQSVAQADTSAPETDTPVVVAAEGDVTTSAPVAAAQEQIIHHKVVKGDTFASLAERYGVSITSIQETNGIKTLRPGRVVKIHTGNMVAVTDTVAAGSDFAAQPAPAPESSTVEDTPVNTNEVVQTMAEQNKVEKTSPRKKNSKKTERKKYHTAKSGDTFSRIASRNGISLKQLQKLNPGVNPNKVKIGQKIRVK